ncbi:TonB-dependent receptor [Novosphingobium sp. AAP1]|uniref:TonB-dependent receptor n=1 Tax=Novosphingobium sp. B-7 TaxID=1298855 RepID=UPI0003B70105|nr:TonB-dependent receptor [Novosphingobium sp. B-7]KPF54807.1 TonB-dependent receptor [Novosphingobium sp. AAP1]
MKGCFANRAACVLLAGVSVPLFPGLALAEGAPAPQAPAADAAPQADSAVSQDTNAIIVTARRRAESLQTTPVAITAVNAAMLENKAAVNIGDLQGAAPGLLITQQNSGAQAANLSIRGLTYADIEKSQTPTVGVVVDGVTIGTNTGQLQDAFDIAQIEVLRGPQGTLFGANTIGGVVNITRSKPTMTAGMKAEFTYGRWNTWSGKAIGNFGNGETLGLKLWYFHNQSDGFYHNATYNRSDGASKGDSFGGTILFKPADSDFTAQFTIENVIQSFVPVVSNLAKTGEVFCAFEPAQECNRNTTTDLYTTFGQPALSTYHAPDATLEMNYNLGSVKLTSITGWRHSAERQTQDFDGSSTDLYYVDRIQNYTQWSQELRAAGNLIQGLDYVIGGFYFNSKYDFKQCSRVFGFSPNTPPCTFDPAPQIENAKSESYAAFADFNWAIIDKVRLSFGGRWSHDYKYLANGFLGAPFPPGSANFSKFTPKVGIDYRPNSDAMFYASWSRGYRSGGFSPRAGDANYATRPFQPETLDSYEVGAKLDLFDHRLNINLAGYISDYKNMQQNTTIPCACSTGNQTITSNVPGGALIKGIEFDGSLRVSSNFKITASAALMQSHFRRFVVGGLVGTTITPFDYTANRLIYAPTFSGSISGDYTVPTDFGSVVSSLSWRHISPYDEQISIASSAAGTTALGTPGQIVSGNDARVRTVTQDLVDASLTLNFKINKTDAYLRVFGRNLADIRTTTHAFTVAGLWSFGMALEPRTYGGTIGFKF